MAVSTSGKFSVNPHMVSFVALFRIKLRLSMRGSITSDRPVVVACLLFRFRRYTGVLVWRLHEPEMV